MILFKFILKEVNGIIDPTISPINKKFFFSKTYESWINDLHRMYDNKMVLKKDNEEKSSLIF